MPFQGDESYSPLPQGDTALGSLAAFCPGLRCFAPFGARNSATSKLTLRVVINCDPQIGNQLFPAKFVAFAEEFKSKTIALLGRASDNTGN